MTRTLTPEEANKLRVCLNNRSWRWYYKYNEKINEFDIFDSLDRKWFSSVSIPATINMLLSDMGWQLEKARVIKEVLDSIDI
jgi:hypothetical protein